MNHRHFHFFTVNQRTLAALCAVVLLIAASLSACGGSGDENSDDALDDLTLDVSQFASDLQSRLTFQDDMSPVDTAVFYQLYGLDETVADEAALIASTGATAEEIAVIHAASSDQVEAVKDAVKQRIQNQKDGFENYVPQELTKLNDPRITLAGQYVILVVCDDSEAARNAINDCLTGE